MRKLTDEQAKEVAEFVVNETGWDCPNCPCFDYVSDAPDAEPCPVRAMNHLWLYAVTCRQVRLVWLENALKEPTPKIGDIVPGVLAPNCIEPGVWNGETKEETTDADQGCLRGGL